jgi:hypothetical protein
VFPPFEVVLDGDVCVQLRDVVPADVMTDGRFSYRLRLVGGEREAASAEAVFYAMSDAGAPVPAAEP